MRTGKLFIVIMLIFGTASLGIGFQGPKTDIHIFYRDVQDEEIVRYEASLDTFTPDCEELISEGHSIVTIDFSHIALKEIPAVVLSLGSLRELNLVKTGITKIDLRNSAFTGTLAEPFLLRLGGTTPIEEIYLNPSVSYRVWDGCINKEGKWDQRLGDYASNRISIDASAINSLEDLNKFISLLCRNVLGNVDHGSKKSLGFVGTSIFLAEALNLQKIEDDYQKFLPDINVEDKVEESRKNTHAIRVLLGGVRWTEETEVLGDQNNKNQDNKNFGSIIQNFLAMLITAREDYEARRISPVKSAKNMMVNSDS